MNDLEKYFQNNINGRQIHKWVHYFDIYDRYFSKHRNKPIVFLEIGIQNGGSYQMWRHYFGENALFFGIDIDPRCKQFEDERFKVFIGSQQDRHFLQNVLSQIPPIDIVLDDGGHTMVQQIVTFEEVFPKLKLGGTFMVEDTHTSYFLTHGGGYRRRGTFIEYAKRFADVVHGFHFKGNAFVEKYKSLVKSVHFYDSIVIIEKDNIDKPYTKIMGVSNFEENASPLASAESGDKTLSLIFNKILQILRLPSFKLRDDKFR